jgi:hypothetical protein
MGPGIVLIFLFGCGLLAAVSLSLILAYVAALTGRRVRVAACLPFLGLGYLFVAFFAYAFFCEYVRGVDSIITDCWRVPLRGRWELAMVDTPENAAILSESTLIVWWVESLAFQDPWVVGTFRAEEDKEQPRIRKGDIRPFVLSLRTGEVSYPSSEDFAAACRKTGLAGIPRLEPAWEFYRRRRFGVWDALAGMIILVFPFFLYSRWRRRSSRREATAV